MLYCKKREKFHNYQNVEINHEITDEDLEWEYLYSIANCSDFDEIDIMDIEEYKEDFDRFVKESRNHKSAHEYEYIYKYQIEHNEEIQAAKCQISEIVTDLRQKNLILQLIK